MPPVDFKYALPTANKAEFAFVGRSNVGKSSLVGKLLGDKSLVRVSKTPGCTQTINYYAMEKPNGGKDLSNVDFYFIDLPGYGFAKAAKTDRGKWEEIISQFLLSRNQSVLRLPSCFDYHNQ